MKELTIEEKAKAYDKAIERAQSLKNKWIDEDGEDVAFMIFPELKESEDEETRKRIIALVNAHGQGMYKDEMLAWIEKQGEQKLPIEKLPFEMKTLSESLGFTTQKECDDYNKMVTNLIMSDDKGEQKTAWSKEDDYVIERLFCLLHNEQDKYPQQSSEFKELEEIENKLKSFKDRVQPKQEWSEEDEETLKDIITSMTNLKDSATSDALRDIYNSKIDWLKSLKGRYTWKPSDEQMKALWDSIPENVKEISEREMLLDSLYQDLKKLREE